MSSPASRSREAVSDPQPEPKTPPLFVRTTLTIPGAGSVVNIAELVELNPHECRMVRMIELTPDHAITGAFIAGRVIGNANRPLDTVPHPDTYDQFEGIEAENITADHFEGLWEEARAKFPEL